MTAALFSLTCISITACAQNDEPAEENTLPATTETVAKPLITDGTGTAVDNATGEDGKAFFSITTPSENIFLSGHRPSAYRGKCMFSERCHGKDLFALAEADSEPKVKELVT